MTKRICKDANIELTITRPDDSFERCEDCTQGEIDDPEAYASGIVPYNTHFDNLEL
jgi:hypothetical protein